MRIEDQIKKFEEEAQKIEKFLSDLTAQFPDIPEVVVIGGFAVRAHGAKRFSHDGDIMVDMNVYAALRDLYTVVKTPRLGKSQFTTNFDTEIDVYVENQHKLRIPFDEIQAHAVKKDQLWVACVEHLIVLKLDALKSRRNTDKGDKDIEDIILLVTLPKITKPELLKSQLTPEDWELLNEVIDTARYWQAFTKNNHKEASRLQKLGKAALKELKAQRPRIE